MTTEQTTEVSTETDQKSETATTDQDEISEAVKQDNKDDLKLGATATVNQSWGTGSASATASLNMGQDTGSGARYNPQENAAAKLEVVERDSSELQIHL